MDITPKQFNLFSKMIRDTLGVNLGTHKTELLKSRLGKRLKALGIASFKDYYTYVTEIDQSGEELANMAAAITTNVTSFYREPHHFEFLKEVVLPEIMARNKRIRRNKIRCWSAGCSTGEEPYTIAMAIKDFIDMDSERWDVRILATDVSQKVLGVARKGVYKKESLEKLDAPTIKKHFKCGYEHKKGLVKVKKHLMDMVTVRHLNLMGKEFPFKSSFDIIFCRNVLIYFNKETQFELLGKFHRHLAPDGYLFLGHSEGLTGGVQGFNYAAPTVYTKEELAPDENLFNQGQSHG